MKYLVSILALLFAFTASTVEARPFNRGFNLGFNAGFNHGFNSGVNSFSNVGFVEAFPIYNSTPALLFPQPTFVPAYSLGAVYSTGFQAEAPCGNVGAFVPSFAPTISYAAPVQYYTQSIPVNVMRVQRFNPSVNVQVNNGFSSVNINRVGVNRNLNVQVNNGGNVRVVDRNLLFGGHVTRVITH